LSICACQPCARAMLIFFVSFHKKRMIPEENPKTGRLEMVHAHFARDKVQGHP